MTSHPITPLHTNPKTHQEEAYEAAFIAIVQPVALVEA